MLFYILFVLMIVAVPGAVAIGYILDSKSRCPDTGFICAMSGVMALIPAMFFGLPVFITWSEHASDISKVVAQEHRIKVQADRIESLSRRLEQFDYPDKPRISLDADTPWASIVESLTDAENQLAEAKDERAIAIRSIEARKRGPMSGVVSFVGDYGQPVRREVE